MHENGFNVVKFTSSGVIRTLDLDTFIMLVVSTLPGRHIFNIKAWLLRIRVHYALPVLLAFFDAGTTTTTGNSDLVAREVGKA